MLDKNCVNSGNDYRLHDVLSKVLSYLPSKEQVNVSKVSREFYRMTHTFWEENNTWIGAPLQFKVLFCRSSYTEKIHPCLGGLISQDYFVRGSIKYEILDPALRISGSCIYRSYATNAQIMVLCYNKIQDLTEFNERYDFLQTINPNARVVLVCTNSQNLSQQETDLFLMGKTFSHRCCTNDPTILRNIINFIGYQLAIQKIKEDEPENHGCTKSNCLIL